MPLHTQPEQRITLDEARYISLAAQRLEGQSRATRKRPTKEDIFEMIAALGCVQLDTISVVARSHETVLWSRLGDFDPRLVQELFFPDRRLIEYWAHAAAITPASMFPYFRRSMRQHHHDEPANASSWAGRNRDFLNEVLNRIERDGPLASRDFERPDGPRPDPWTWYGGKPAKQALSALWTSGELVVQQRVGFQRIYDLTDRHLPGLRDEPLPTEAEQRRFFIANALRAIGIATAPWTKDYFRRYIGHVSAADTVTELKAMAREGLAVPVQIDDLPQAFWLDPGAIAVLESHRQGARPQRTTLLSPFDSLVWNRDRALTLFDFDYRIECYTPAEKRRFGYYTLPILHRGRLVGRLDPVYKRRDKRLILNAVHLESGVRPTKTLARSISKAVRDYADFLGGGTIEVARSEPEALAAMLRTELSGGESETG